MTLTINCYYFIIILTRRNSVRYIKNIKLVTLVVLLSVLLFVPLIDRDEQTIYLSTNIFEVDI